MAYMGRKDSWQQERTKMINKSKLIFIYSVVFVYLASIGLTHLNPSFIALALISMGFIFGFMANEIFFKEDRVTSINKYSITEGNTLANIRTHSCCQMPSEPPSSLSKKEEKMSEKETIRVSFTFDIDVGSDLDQELEFLHAKAKHSRIKKLVEDHIREKIKDPVSNPDFLKDIKVDFSICSRTREQIISSMCFTYRHDYGLVKNPGSISGMTEEERNSLWNRMAHIFDNDIAPYVDLKCFNNKKLEISAMLK